MSKVKVSVTVPMKKQGDLFKIEALLEPTELVNFAKCIIELSEGGE